MADQNGEKSQDPTPHRRRQARQEGQVAKSQDLGSAALLVVGLITLLMLGGALVEFIGRYTQRQLDGPAWLSADASLTTWYWNRTFWELARHLLPVLGVLLLAAIAVNVLQIGFLFVPKRLSMDLSRLDPIKGLQRLFSLAGVMRLVFGIFKILVIAAVAFASLYAHRETILGMVGMSVPQVAFYTVEIMIWTAMKIGVALLILAILDYAFQKWKHEQDLKMTQQEVREEMRNLEGDPQVVARRKAVQRQLVMNRMSDAVPNADVVVTNPTELAVAIQYEPASMAAPVVVAKGAGLMAQRIRKIALENGIPVVERKPLAQALYRDVEINQPVPQERYAAVAEVLAYVYQLKGKKIPDHSGRAA
jgi:flagellar biosynthetic protein FlhB